MAAATKRRRGPPPPDDVTAGAAPAGRDGNDAAAAERPAAEAGGTTSDPQRPVHVVSYLVARDTFVQAAIWARPVTLADGTAFTAHDVGLRKRVRGDDGEWMS